MMKILYELNCESLSVPSQSVPTVAFARTWCCKAINMNLSLFIFLIPEVWSFRHVCQTYCLIYCSSVYPCLEVSESSSEENTVIPLHNGTGTMLDQYYTCHKENILPVSHCSSFVSLKTPSPSGSVTNPYNVPLC